VSVLVQLALDAQAARAVGDRRREAEALLALLSEADVRLDDLPQGDADGWEAIERVRGIRPRE